MTVSSRESTNVGAPIPVHARHRRMVPVIIIIVVIIISMMVIVVASHLRTAAIPHTLPHRSRVSWSIVAAVSHEICIKDNDPQATLSLFYGVISSCK